MTTTAKPTALTADQVEAQIRLWVRKGLPEGRISWPDLRGHYVRIHVQTATEVAIWAAALSTDIEINHYVMRTHPAFPSSLRGWDIQVWCTAPTVPAALRIRTLDGAA